MNFKPVHNNYNVFDLDKSIAFYQNALGMKEVRRKVAGDESFILVYMACEGTPHQVELTWLRDRKEPYNLGDNEIHLAFTTDDYEGAKALHQSMNCICFDNEAMGIYFISDPDGYWIEIIPEKR